MSSVTAIPAPTAIYREDQLFAWWVYALMAGMLAITCLFLRNRPVGVDGPASAIAVGLGLVLPSLFVVGFLRMTTIVTATCVEVWFGFVPTYRRQVAIDTVTAIEVATYRPLAECGGWGIRSGTNGERVLNARGNRGVRLTLVDGGSLLIGSQSPELLAASIDAGIGPVV